MKALELPPHILAGSVYPFRSANMRSAPNVCNPGRTLELGPLPGPFGRREGLHSVAAKIGTPCRISMRVCVTGQGLKCVRRREIPQMIRGQVLPSRRIRDPAGIVGSVKRQTTPLPLVPKPGLHGHSVKERWPDVLDANLGCDWQLSQGLGVCVSGDVTQSLVPDVTVFVFPAEGLQDRMHRRPSNLGIPEPKRCLRRCLFRPSAKVRNIPLRQTISARKIAGITADPIRTVAHNASWRRPFGIEVLGGTETDFSHAAPKAILGLFRLGFRSLP